MSPAPILHGTAYSLYSVPANYRVVHLVIFHKLRNPENIEFLENTFMTLVGIIRCNKSHFLGMAWHARFYLSQLKVGCKFSSNFTYLAARNKTNKENYFPCSAQISNLDNMVIWLKLWCALDENKVEKDQQQRCSHFVNMIQSPDSRRDIILNGKKNVIFWSKLSPTRNF